MWSMGRKWQTTSVFLPWEPQEQFEKVKRYDTERWTPRLVGAQFATEEGWRNNSRKNEGMEPKWTQHPVMDVTGDGSKVWSCGKQYRIGTWNLRFMNQGKFSFNSVQSLSYVQLFATPRTAAHQASLPITNSQSLLKLMSVESVLPSNPLILCRPLLLLPSVFPSIRVFSNESVLLIRWPKH